MKKIQYLFVLLMLFSAAPLFAGALLSIKDGDTHIELSIEEVRKQADTEFTIFAPFRGREVKMRGIVLDTLLQNQLSRVPAHIKLIAHDGYSLDFQNWKPDHWVVVTHEDGEPLSLRQQGPLRLVERGYTGKNPKNLRNFNDWVWMLQRIEVIK